MPAAATPIETARDRTHTIQQELEVAGAELHLANAALESSLPAAARQGDVGKALEQNAAIEEKVLEAAEDLQAVTELLAEEVAQRAWLERELAIARSARP
jgi:hypothetical protein